MIGRAAPRRFATASRTRANTTEKWAETASAVCLVYYIHFTYKIEYHGSCLGSDSAGEICGSAVLCEGGII